MTAARRALSVLPTAGAAVIASFLVVVTVAFAVVAAGCTSAVDVDQAAVVDPSQPAQAEPMRDGGAEPDIGQGDQDDDGDEAVAGGDFDCRPLELWSDGEVERTELIETSGLAASRQHDDVLWGHNDSGNPGGLFAFDLAGRDLGFFDLVDDGQEVAVIDTEDLAIVDSTIYLADFGDRGQPRTEIAIHVITEPEPGQDGVAEVERTIRARYPDGPTDAEALLVDPLTGDLLVFSKDIEAPRELTRLYALTGDGSSSDNSSSDSSSNDSSSSDGEPVDLTLVGTLDAVALTRAGTGFSLGSLTFPGAVTAADITTDGRLIAVRTYGSIWLFNRHPDQTMGQALTGTPCEARPATESQGEAVAFLPTGGPTEGDGSVRIATVSEGLHPPVNLLEVSVDGTFEVSG